MTYGYLSPKNVFTLCEGGGVFPLWRNNMGPPPPLSPQALIKLLHKGEPWVFSDHSLQFSKKPP